MSFFKLVMIVLLKIYVAVKIFVKISLKAIRDTFFSNMLSVITFSLAGGPPPPIPSLNVTS